MEKSYTRSLDKMLWVSGGGEDDAKGIQGRRRTFDGMVKVFYQVQNQRMGISEREQVT